VALRRLPVAFGFVKVIESFPMTKSLAMTERMIGEGHRALGEGARMADPRRMTPAEHGEAHALLVRAVTDPDRHAASQALEDLMGKLLAVRRLLEAEARLPKREPRADPT
jgi:hypothetical protein